VLTLFRIVAGRAGWPSCQGHYLTRGVDRDSITDFDYSCEFLFTWSVPRCLHTTCSQVRCPKWLMGKSIGSIKFQSSESPPSSGTVSCTYNHMPISVHSEVYSSQIPRTSVLVALLTTTTSILKHYTCDF
jgi:hypothetical protein